MKADHAKTKEDCMTRFVGHGQPIIHVFETAIILNMVKSVKCQFFNPTGPDFVGLSHIINMNASKMYYMVLKLQFTHDYVLHMDKLYVSLHVMRLKWTTQKIINILMY